jgi:hypothetical protein
MLLPDSFDVRWIRSTVSGSLVISGQQAQRDYNLNVLGGCRGKITLDELVHDSYSDSNRSNTRLVPCV